MNIDEIKTNVKNIINESVLLAKDDIKDEKNLLEIERSISEAKVVGRQKAIEYLYGIIEKLLEK